MENTDVQAVEPAIAENNADVEVVSDEPTEKPQDAESATAVIEPDEATEKAKAGVQKRFDELTRDKYAERRARENAEREAAYWRDKAEKPAAPVAVVAKPKTLADFDFDEGAYASHLRQEAVQDARKAVADEMKREREAQTAQTRQTKWLERVATFSKSAPDFDQVVFQQNDLPISAHMAEVISEREDGPALAYYLGQNPEVASAISRLSPGLAGAELGEIAASLKVEKTKPVPVVSKAPPPVPRIEGSDAGPPVRTTDPSGDKLSDDEWFAAERKRLSRKR